MKLLPKGINKFTEIIDKNRLFVDKTGFIRTLDESGEDFLFFVRPRRFGKSIFLNMLETYYDIARKDKFAHYFGDTWIYDHVTVEQGKYLVVRLDFSKVSGDSNSVAADFDSIIGTDIDTYAEKYCSYFKEGFLEKIAKMPSAKAKLNYFCQQAGLNGYPFYLMIDEYDNFTNAILTSEGKEKYHDITHGTGFYREFFKVAKAGFQKIFMTGIAPVTLDDLTSGYNIATHITLDPVYNGMMGFTSEEVRGIIASYQKEGLLHGWNPDEIVSGMSLWYDGYCFSEEAFSKGEHVFNSYMVSAFISELAKRNVWPKDMAVQNTLTDYEKLRRIMILDQIRKGEEESRETVLDGLIAGKEYNRPVAVSFPAAGLLKTGNFISYLFYLGMLTVKGVRGISPILGIPNLNVKMQYYRCLLEMAADSLSENFDGMMIEAVNEAAFCGTIRKFAEITVKQCARYSGNRQLKMQEGLYQAFFLAFLSLNPLYEMAPEIELNHGYNDIFLFPKPGAVGVKHSYLIELKYLKTDAPDSDKNRETGAARRQLLEYARDPKARILAQSTTLHRTVIVMKGFELEFFEDVCG